MEALLLNDSHNPWIGADPAEKTLPCDGWELRKLTDGDILTFSLHALSCIAGLFLILFGYRLIQASLFLAGFFIGSAVVYTICFQSSIPPEANVGISLAAGAVLGLVTLLVRYMGLFALGVNGGFIVGTLAVMLHEHVSPVPSFWWSIAYLTGCSLGAALLNLKFQKVMTIFSSSLLGAALVLIIVDFIFDFSALWKFAVSSIRADTSSDQAHLCWFSYITAISLPFFFFLGLALQGTCTAYNFNHNEVHLYHRRRERYTPRRVEVRTEKELSPESRYRQLYQVRRFQGDVISQDFVRTFRQKLPHWTSGATPDSADSTIDIHPNRGHISL